ncbi:DUF2232 domain-containing protein [Paenibacillus zeisoli]|uniref:DUF2232 domain-containing protein n=1 Tax=Paenibacillus zeisoli TaxID=2496267 RepID=A0A3S1D7N3_9BACL|nr:DUF2232 domain-containing protein [Paenibacillus zeisoli]RUT33731.1 DUF2232 domain-containing protein [Paenibacillus zeisoli]
MKFHWTTAAWSIVYFLLLLSLVTPLTVVTVLFLLVPGVILYTTLSRTSFILHVVPVLLLLLFLLGPYYILVPLYFLIPSIIMGHMYKTRAPAARTLLVGAATILVEFILLLLVSTVFFDFNLAQTIEDVINTTSMPLRDMTGSNLVSGLDWTEKKTELLSDLVRTIPFTMTVTSLAIAAVTHAIARPTLSSLGQITPKMKPFRELRLPRSLVWYYCIGLIIQLFAGTAAREGFLGTVLVNLMPLLQFGFIIQAAGLFFYLAYVKKWNLVIPILLTIAMIFIRPLWIIGLFDIAFPLRDMITRSRR